MNELSFDEYYEFKDRTIEALLLQFGEEIKDGYNIPSAFSIREVLKKIPKEKFQERVREGLSAILKRGMSGPEHGSDSVEDYLMRSSSRFTDWEWIVRYGSLFRIKPEKRDEVEQRVGEYWSAEEMRDFETIGKVLRERELSLSMLGKGHKMDKSKVG